MRVALVHDDLVQWGGAERVLLALSEIFPEASIYTSLFDQNHPLLKKFFGSKKIFTSFMQRIPKWKAFYKTLLPLYPIAFEQFNFGEFDLVISNTTRFAKSVITKPATTHICYCHTPPRFLWNFSNQLPPSYLKPYFNFLRIYDKVASNRVDVWVAGSVNAQKRILEVYQKESYVVYPFVDIEYLGQVEPFEGGYLLAIARLNKYKRVDIIIEAAKELNIPLKIVGVGPEEESLKKQSHLNNIEFLGLVEEEMLRVLLSGCKALVVAAEEDFGLTPLETQALGKPVIAYRKGGVLETVKEGVTGYFFDHPTVESLVEALLTLDKSGYNVKECQKQAARFSKRRFIDQFKKFLSTYEL